MKAPSFAPLRIDLKAPFGLLDGLGVLGLETGFLMGVGSLGLDIQKRLGKTGIEFHWPGYQYMGPGTKLEKRLKQGDPRVNRLDRIAKQHDIDHSKAKNLQDKWKADAKMIESINKLPGKKTMNVS